MGVPLYVICYFLLFIFNILSLSLIFISLITLCLGVFLLGFILLETLCFLDLVDYFLSHIKGVLRYYFFNVSSGHFSLSSSGTHICES